MRAVMSIDEKHVADSSQPQVLFTLTLITRKCLLNVLFVELTYLSNHFNNFYYC